MTGFAEAHAARPHRQRGTVCSVQRARKTMTPTDREAFDAVLASDDTSASIADTLQSIELPVRQHSVARHRRGDCLCERTGE